VVLCTSPKVVIFTSSRVWLVFGTAVVDPELEPYPQQLTTALFSFLYHLASYENGESTHCWPSNWVVLSSSWALAGACLPVLGPWANICDASPVVHLHWCWASLPPPSTRLHLTALLGVLDYNWSRATISTDSLSDCLSCEFRSNV